MVNNYYKKKETLNMCLNALIKFRVQWHNQPSIIGGLFCAQYDTKTILMYYKLRKLLRKKIKDIGIIKNTIKKLPIGALLLRKYINEIILLLHCALSFYLYNTYLPIFRGKLALFCGIYLLIWGLTRIIIYDIEREMTRGLNKLIKLIEGELDLIRFLEKN